MTTFKFASTDLSTIGKVIVINEYLDIPERRGDNQLIPFRHGKVFSPKFYDERTFTFGLTITAADAAALETAIETARALFSVQNEQILEITMEDASVREILCTVNRGLQVNRITGNIAKLVVEFVASNPIWRSDTLIADNTVTISASPTALVFDNTGTIEERDPIIYLTGPLENTVITNSTNGCTLTYTGAIAGGEDVIIQTVNGEYTAIKNGTTNVIGNVSHTGASALMVVDVGTNTFAITDDVATTGTVQISFYPPYL